MQAKTAAFFDLDGTLLRGNILNHYVYYARTDPSLSGRLLRLLKLGTKVPYFWTLDRIDRHMFNEVFYKSYAGLSQDRLAVLGQELWDLVLSKNLYPGAQALIDGDRGLGRKLVLLTGALDFVAAPAAKALGFDFYFASHLEYDKNGLATGELLPPVMAGPEKAQFVRAFCREHDLDIEQCVAYADDAADLPMLSTVGRPVAVNPDIRLATTARSHHWPIVRLSQEKSLADRARQVASSVVGTARDVLTKARKENEERLEAGRRVTANARSVVSWLKDLARDSHDQRDERHSARSSKSTRGHSTQGKADLS
jgi:HAD superfamily hydrolase (TIGR01490 family)